jgi:hypothetical protein
MLKFTLFCSILYTSSALTLLSLSNQTESSSSGKLSPAEKSCNNVTACIECNKNKCYEYDLTAKSCNKIGQQKTMILLLHIFTGSFGVAAFVVGNVIIGGIQLGLISSPILWAFWYACPFDKKGEVNDCLAKGFSCVSYSTAIGLWIWYLILIIENKVLGINGCPLLE